jgi:hypothetical protein
MRGAFPGNRDYYDSVKSFIRWGVFKKATQLRANTNYGLLFLNGQPPILNVEDLKLRDQSAVRQDPHFQNTKAQFPNVAVWPGDRDGTTWPKLPTRTEWRSPIHCWLPFD